MKREILKCPNCSDYTLKKQCPKCNIKTLTPKPAKYSIEDKTGHWRRKYKLKYKQNVIQN